MQLYRIAHCKHINDLAGTGGLYASGRWHNKGTRIIYFSEHISLAKLEVLANSNFLLKTMCLLTIKMNDHIKIEVLEKEQLDIGWNSFPYPESLKMITHNWLKANKSVALKVPSAQSDKEYNFLLNPLHPDINKINIISSEKIKFDHRLKL